MAAARVTELADCSRWVYCGAPYYLPVLSLVQTGHALPADAPPLVSVAASLATAPLNASTQLLVVNVTGEWSPQGRIRAASAHRPLSPAGPSHVVVMVSPVEDSRVAWSSVVAAPTPAGRWNGRPVYFFALHQARGPQPWHLRFHIEVSVVRPPPPRLPLCAQPP